MIEFFQYHRINISGKKDLQSWTYKKNILNIYFYIYSSDHDASCQYDDNDEDIADVNTIKDANNKETLYLEIEIVILFHL